MSGMAQTPAHSNLCSVRSIKDSTLLTDENGERYKLISKQLLYYAKRVRPNLIVMVDFLAKRVSAPQRDDMGNGAIHAQYQKGYPVRKPFLVWCVDHCR